MKVVLFASSSQHAAVGRLQLQASCIEYYKWNALHIIIADIHPLYGIANYMLCKTHYGNELIVHHLRSERVQQSLCCGARRQAAL